MAKTPDIDIREDYQRNILINGNFDLWQRGTSFSSAGYTADRWRVPAAQTVTRQSNSNTPFKYSLKSSSSSTANQVEQRIEAGNVRQYIDKQLTVSFKAKLNSGSMDLKVVLESADAEDDFSTTTQVSSTTLDAMTGSFQDFSLTFTVTQTMAENGFSVVLGDDTSVTAEFELAQVQLVEGAEALPFRRAGRNFDEELQLCQRYYQRGFQRKVSVSSYSANNISFRIPAHTTFRAVPTVSQIPGTSLTNSLERVGISTVTPSVLSPSGGFTPDYVQFDCSYTGVAYEPCSLKADIIQADAEL